MSLYKVNNVLLKANNVLVQENPLWNNLKSYWRFNETAGTSAADSKGSVTGTLVRCSFDASGKNAYCVNTTGGTSSISMGNNYAYERTQPFTYAFWFKNNAAWSANLLFAKTINTGGYTGYQIFVDNTNFYTDYISNYGAGQSIRKVYSASGFFNDTSNWHYLIATYAGTSLASGCLLYLDGSLKTATSTAYDNLNATMVSNANLCLGNRYELSIGVNARFDEFGIWNRVLSQAEVTQLYNAGNGLFY